MNTRAALCLALLLGACATRNPVPRPETPPPRWVDPAGASGQNAKGRFEGGDASDRFLRDEIERKTHLAPVPAPQPRYVVPQDTRQSYEPETKRFLEGEIGRKTPPPEPEVRYVYIDRPLVYGRDYDYGRPAYYGQRRESSFPWNAAWGAGIGAIIGNQHHHQAGRGAWIGGGIGLLLDIARWHR